MVQWKHTEVTRRRQLYCHRMRDEKVNFPHLWQKSITLNRERERAGELALVLLNRKTALSFGVSSLHCVKILFHSKGCNEQWDLILEIGNRQNNECLTHVFWVFLFPAWFSKNICSRKGPSYYPHSREVYRLVWRVISQQRNDIGKCKYDLSLPWKEDGSSHSVSRMHHSTKGC